MGEYDEAVSVSFLFAISEWLERKAAERARKALGALAELRPDYDRDVNSPNYSGLEDVEPVEDVVVPHTLVAKEQLAEAVAEYPTQPLPMIHPISTVAPFLITAPSHTTAPVTDAPSPSRFPAPPRSLALHSTPDPDC